MGKILISTLGVNDYVPCNYCFDAGGESENVIENVRFVQEAAVRNFCKNWNSANGDRIRILCTSEAKEKNWFDDGQKEKCEGLKTRLDRILEEPKYSGLDTDSGLSLVGIDKGNSESEIWNVFEVIFGLIKDNDEVWFDITHAFRSLPMLALVVLQYARKLKKNMKIKAIFYGAFEILGPINIVIENPMEKRNAPVFDLTDFVRLMEWTDAANDFVDYGQTENLVKLLSDEFNPVLKQTKGKDNEAQLSNGIGKKIKILSETIKNNDLVKIVESVSLDNLLREYTTITGEHAKAFVPIVEKIRQKTEKFKENDLGNVFAAARWCVNHGMYQNAYSILLEGCISIALYFVGEKWKPSEIDQSDKAYVQKLRSIPTNVARDIVHRKRKEDADRISNVYEKVQEIITVDVAEVFVNLIGFRNAYMHCGTGINPLPGKLFQRMIEFIDKMESWFLQLNKP